MDFNTQNTSQHVKSVGCVGDTIYRQAAIDIAMQYCPDDDGSCSKEGVDIREMLDELEDMPSAQLEIIRCKDCKWKQGSECVRFADVRPFPDDFCSRAERKTDE